MERRPFDDTLEAVNYIVANMVARGEFDEQMETVGNRLTAIEHRITALESKVSGIHRRLDDEAMERMDTKALFERLSKLEEEVFGREKINH